MRTFRVEQLYSNEDNSGRTPQGKKPQKQTPGAKRTPKAGQNRPEFDLCALRRGHRPGIQPHSHIVPTRRRGHRPFTWQPVWANLKPRNERAFRSLRGSEPRSTGHFVFKKSWIFRGKSPRSVAIFALSSELEDEPPRGGGIVRNSPHGALRGLCGEVFRFKQGYLAVKRRHPRDQAFLAELLTLILLNYLFYSFKINIFYYNI